MTDETKNPTGNQASLALTREKRILTIEGWKRRLIKQKQASKKDI